MVTVVLLHLLRASGGRGAEPFAVEQCKLSELHPDARKDSCFFEDGGVVPMDIGAIAPMGHPRGDGKGVVCHHCGKPGRLARDFWPKVKGHQ